MTTKTEQAETYNGWANYPTWAVNLWLSNDEGLYRETRSRVQEIIAETGSRSEYWSLEESHRYATADMLRDFVEELAHEEYDKASFVSDLIGYALGDVNWHEIADGWIEGERDA